MRSDLFTTDKKHNISILHRRWTWFEFISRIRSVETVRGIVARDNEHARAFSYFSPHR